MTAGVERPFGARRCLVAGWILMVLTASGAARGADPFYEQLLADGIAAHARGDYPAAAQDLRLACFGLLDEPKTLAECLAYLAISQAEIGDVAAFGQTFERILEVERLDGAFSSLELRPDLRSAFELRVEQWIPYEKLARSPTFRRIARRKRLLEIREMPPDVARLELEQRIIAEPDYAPWRLLLAEMSLAAGDATSALAAADTVLARGSTSPAAACIRGKAHAALGDCQSAFEDLAACEGLESPSRLVEIRIRCHMGLRAWDEAAVLLDGLSIEERQSAPFRQLGKQIKRGRRGARTDPGATALPSVDPSAASVEAAPGDSASEVTMPVAQSQPPGVPQTREEGSGEQPQDVADRVSSELAAARDLLANGSRQELVRAFLETRQVADRHPQLTEPQLLVAEMAYRLSRWQDAVTHFRRAGELGNLRPEHQFYLAVSLYEAGDPAAAREILRLCLDRLEPTEFVSRYSAKINSGAGQ